MSPKMAAQKHQFSGAISDNFSLWLDR